jgi:hypothetical protein
VGGVDSLQGGEKVGKRRRELAHVVDAFDACILAIEPSVD